MPRKPKSWLNFEDACRSIVSAHKDFFGLDSVEPGAATAKGKSGQVWNIEVIEYTKNKRKLVLFECRRKTTRNLEPGHAAEFAYRIEDTGAAKGYFVTTLKKGLSKGAKTISDFEKIGHISLSPDVTPDKYLMQCLNHFFLGLSDKLTFDDSFAFALYDRDGNLVQQG